ncbi:GerAB/ArcD/ProY family transporter [Bacillus sp. FJAT-49732]|uniref:GerAB/ArcD/ProY family transporter n=1 Tax=Lederbergia citrisecunda TaxID=2833583 RepID=A0A942TTN3_9BACI|nr:GerAB/ArcD/ProY family transporter [Lederbergia citrisecunda]MBS4201984.1 GerAB/ArcD/ProY family transporter [Lederbergia citrisecunda]
MNRYVYYLLYVNMFANMVVSVPKILLYSRKDGAIIAIVLAIIAGTIVIYAFVRFFKTFPGKDYPELIKKTFSPWLYFPYLLFLALIWFIAGLHALVTYSFLLKRFLTPDMSIIWIASTFLIFISYGILMHTKSILYTIEALLLIFVPIILFLIVKTYSSPEFVWDFVRESIMYVYHFPSYMAFTAAFYVYLGITNLVIFNRAFTKHGIQISRKQVLLMASAGVVILSTIFFAPIGMSGFEQIDKLVYPSISTSDTLRMRYGIIERVLYLFLLFFLAITFLNLLIHWHVSIEFLKSLFWIKKFKHKENNLTPFIFLTTFWIVALITATYLNEYQVFTYARYFFYMLPITTSIIILTFWFIKRRVKV